MRKTLLCVVLFLITVNAHGADGTGAASGVDAAYMNINVMVGQKYLDNDWGSGDSQFELGLLFDYKESGWPVSGTIELFKSSHTKDANYKAFGTTMNDGRYTSSSREICLGVKRIWDVKGSSIHPFVGGGFAYVSADQKFSGYDLSNNYHSHEANDSKIGLWVSGGAYYTWDGHFNVGLIARLSRAKVTLFDYGIEAGGSHIGLMLGYHF